MHKTLLLLLSLTAACTTPKKELTLEEKLELIHTNALDTNPFDTYKDELIEADCSQVDQMLSDIYEADQEVRLKGLPMESTDHSNLIEVLSILKFCGLPSASQLTSAQSKNAIALVLQHQPNQDISAFFLPEIKEGVEKGIIPEQIYALIIDRQLMFNGYPQYYGSQIFDGKLYELLEPETVDERRNSMKLNTLEANLDRFGLTLDGALADQFPAEELQKILVKPKN